MVGKFLAVALPLLGIGHRGGVCLKAKGVAIPLPK